VSPSRVPSCSLGDCWSQSGCSPQPLPAAGVAAATSLNQISKRRWSGCRTASSIDRSRTREADPWSRGLRGFARTPRTLRLSAGTRGSVIALCHASGFLTDGFSTGWTRLTAKPQAPRGKRSSSTRIRPFLGSPRTSPQLFVRQRAAKTVAACRCRFGDSDGVRTATARRGGPCLRPGSYPGPNRQSSLQGTTPDGRSRHDRPVGASGGARGTRTPAER
jgi:hypothetical protein